MILLIMNQSKLSVPNPCSEGWDKMIPTEKGRFCSQCNRTVVDFTNMTNAEIRNYLKSQKGKRVCGYFRTEQL